VHLLYRAEATGEELDFPRQKTNVLDVLHVSGDNVATRSTARTDSRIILLPDARGKIDSNSNYNDNIEDVESYTTLCCEKGICLSVVFADGLAVEDVVAEEEEDAAAADNFREALDYDRLFSRPDKDAVAYCSESESDDDTRAKEQKSGRGEDTVRLYFGRYILNAAHESYQIRYSRAMDRRSKAIRAHLLSEEEEYAAESSLHTTGRLVVPSEGALRKMGLLCSAARATGGTVYNVAEMSSDADNPRPKLQVTKAKFAGVLDFAGAFKIPVRLYSRVGELQRPSAKKVAWDTTRVQQRFAFVNMSRGQYFAESEFVKKEDEGPKMEVTSDLVAFA
jgi:hypothetical protein